VPGAVQRQTLLGRDSPAEGDVLSFVRDQGGSRTVRVKLSNPALMRVLLAEFAFDANVVVSQIADDEVEVSFLGSLNASAQQMEIELRMLAWLSAHPDAVVVVRE
jgi:hypothetical protein